MRRSFLVSLIALGVIITGVSGTGLFAALSDTASTGDNRVETAAMPMAADLKMASATGGPGSAFGCGTFSDNLSTGLFSVTDAAPGMFQTSRLCLRNDGSSPVAVTSSITIVSDTDVACSGDEAALGDTTCGEDQAGELGSTIETAAWPQDCATGSGANTTSWQNIAGYTPTANIGSVNPGQTVCVHIGLDYFNPPQAEFPLAQTDEVTWRWVSTGQA